MKPTRNNLRGVKWVYSGGGWGEENRRRRRLERRYRAREAQAEINQS